MYHLMNKGDQGMMKKKPLKRVIKKAKKVVKKAGAKMKKIMKKADY